MPETPQKKPEPGTGRGRVLREVAPYMGVGTTFAASVGAGLAVGYWLDSRFGTDPYATLVGGIVGLIAGSVHFFVKMSGGKR